MWKINRAVFIPSFPQAGEAETQIPLLDEKLKPGSEWPGFSALREKDWQFWKDSAQDKADKGLCIIY